MIDSTLLEMVAVELEAHGYDYSVAMNIHEVYETEPGQVKQTTNRGRGEYQDPWEVKRLRPKEGERVKTLQSKQTESRRW